MPEFTPKVTWCVYYGSPSFVPLIQNLSKVFKRLPWKRGFQRTSNHDRATDHSSFIDPPAAAGFGRLDHASLYSEMPFFACTCKDRSQTMQVVIVVALRRLSPCIRSKAHKICISRKTSKLVRELELWFFVSFARNLGKKGGGTFPSSQHPAIFFTGALKPIHGC